MYLQNRNRRNIIKARIGGYKMISKINGLTPLVKVTKNPKATIAAATAGTLAVLSTHRYGHTQSLVIVILKQMIFLKLT